MKLQHHTAFSIIISAITYMIFKSWGIAIVSLISGIFIDLDHLLDYFVEYGWPLKIKKFFYVFEEGQISRAFLLLHGWEWLILLAVTSWSTNWNPWITGMLIGFGQHMLIDKTFNGISFKSYSLLWRWKNGFHRDSFFENTKGPNYNSVTGSEQ